MFFSPLFLSLPGQFLVCFSWSLSRGGFLQIMMVLCCPYLREDTEKLIGNCSRWSGLLMSDFGAASCAVEIPDARLENSFLCSCSVFQEGKPHFFFYTLFSFGQRRRSGNTAPGVGRIDYFTNRQLTPIFGSQFHFLRCWFPSYLYPLFPFCLL